MRKISAFIIPFLLVALAIIPVGSLDKVEAATKYQDGEYNVPFTVLKENGSEKSMTNDFMVSPAKFIVKNGQGLIQVTLTNSNYWKGFQVNSGAVTVLSESNNTRKVQFPVQDLSQTLGGSVHVVVPEMNYDNNYKVIFKFDASNVPLKSNEAAATASGNQSTSGESAAGDNMKQEANPPTGDHTHILLFAAMLIGSGLIIFRKKAFK